MTEVVYVKVKEEVEDQDINKIFIPIMQEIDDQESSNIYYNSDIRKENCVNINNNDGTNGSYSSIFIENKSKLSEVDGEVRINKIKAVFLMKYCKI